MEPMTLGSPVGSPAATPHAPPTGPSSGSPFLPSYLMGDVASPAASVSPDVYCVIWKMRLELKRK